MKILALLELAADKTPFDLGPYLIPEEIAMWKAYRTGALREIYFQRDPIVVTLVFEADDLAKVNGQLSSFPLVVERLLEVRLITLGPWLPLEKLFDPALMKG